MGKESGVEWAQSSWGPWRGCCKVSPACAHCYAEREMTRFGKDFDTVTRSSIQTFSAPLRWKEGRRVFVCPWSDFFIEEADDWRAEAWNIITQTPQHTYLILTKRISRLIEERPAVDTRLAKMTFDYLKACVLPNVWFGVSVENVRFYKRIEHLQKVDCPVRFLSIEPLLGRMQYLPLQGIGWVIVGGESGPNFRPLNLDWVREIRDRCIERGVPFFFKQHSGFNPKKAGRLLDGREWNEIPKSNQEVVK